MALKKSITLPTTQARLTQSVDFTGYVYPQFLTTFGFNVLTPESMIPGLAQASPSTEKAIRQTKTNLLSNVLNANTGNLMAGVTSFNKTYSREMFKRQMLGNYEYFQVLPGAVSIGLTLDKVVFYDTNNQLDKILDINYDGSIKQYAPLLIIENLKSPATPDDPEGDIKTIMYLDCWIKSSKIDYKLDGKTIVINSLALECAKTFAPIDSALDFASNVFNKMGLVESAISDLTGNTFDLNIGSTL